MTLWDFASAMNRALGIVLNKVQTLFPESRNSVLSVSSLVDIRNEVARQPEWSHATHEQIREEAFRVALGSIGVHDAILAHDLTELYMSHRFGEIDLYADVAPCLSLLRGPYLLGIISNGNCYPERCGLPGVFDFVVFSQQIGIAKPDPRIFQYACQLANVSSDELVHVGDSVDTDVAGAVAAGATSVWLNRDRVSNDSDLVSDHEIGSLDELPGLVERMQCSH